MPIVRFLTEDTKIEVRPGTTLLDASRKAKIAIRTRCGAKASCLMCKVSVDDQLGLNPPNQNEVLKLGSLLQKGIRLSCQATIRSDVIVIVPEDPLKAAIRAKLAEQQRGDDLW